MCERLTVVATLVGEFVVPISRGGDLEPWS